MNETTQLILRVSREFKKAIKQQALDENISVNQMLIDIITPQIKTSPHFVDIKKEDIEDGIEFIADPTNPLPVPDEVLNAPKDSYGFSKSHSVGACEAPNIKCKLQGYKYLVGFMTDEGLKKKEMHLCPDHLKKAKAECESVEEV